jgi:hypothetical protein
MIQTTRTVDKIKARGLPTFYGFCSAVNDLKWTPSWQTLQRDFKVVLLSLRQARIAVYGRERNALVWFAFWGLDF